jgi:hypothetical protein
MSALCRTPNQILSGTPHFKKLTEKQKRRILKDAPLLYFYERLPESSPFDYQLFFAR